MNEKFVPPDDETIQWVLHHPFCIETHKHTFVDYLEVIIREDGTIEYAVPSHVMKLRKIYGKTTEEVFDEFYSSGCKMDPTEWLCQKTKCISVWNTGYVGTANQKQLETLQLLKENNLYEGAISNETVCFPTDERII